MLHLSWLKSWKANVIIQHVTLLLKQKRLEPIEYCSSFTSVSKNGGHARHKSATHAWENTIKRVELRAVDRCVSLLSKLQTPSDSKRWRVTIPPAAQKRVVNQLKLDFTMLYVDPIQKPQKMRTKKGSSVEHLSICWLSPVYYLKVLELLREVFFDGLNLAMAF